MHCTSQGHPVTKWDFERDFELPCIKKPQDFLFSNLSWIGLVSLIPLSQKHPPIIRIRIKIKIAFTNSELPKIIHTLYMSAHWRKKNLDKTDEHAGKGWPLTAPWKLSALFWNCVHKSEVWSRCGYYADNCSIKKVWITLVPFRFYDQIMRILSA